MKDTTQILFGGVGKEPPKKADFIKPKLRMPYFSMIVEKSRAFFNFHLNKHLGRKKNENHRIDD